MEDSRRLVKQLLRANGFELTVPSGPRRARRARIRRFHLPADVAATLHHPGRHAMLVPIDRIVNRAGFGYGRQGWHPYVASLELHVRGFADSYERTPLARFYDRFRPRTVHDLLLGADARSPGALAAWPAVDPLIDVWTATPERVDAVRSQLAGTGELPHSQYRGPTSAEFGAMHLQRTLQLYRGIAAAGFRPTEFPSGFVTGYFVTNGDDYRFVVGHGNHRVAALAVLGYVEIPVTLRPGHPPVVARQRLGPWTTAQGGLLTTAEACGVADRLIGDGGRSRAVELDLVSEA